MSLFKNGWLFMKKLTLFSLIVLAFIIAGCNFPGYEGFSLDDSDDTMATEIAKILTGTPGEIVNPPTTEETEIVPTSTVGVEETEPTLEETTKPDNTATPEQDTATPTQTKTPTTAPTATMADTDPALTLGEPDWVDAMDKDTNWPTGETSYASIKFDNGYMKITTKTDNNAWYLSWPILENFYLEAKVQSPNAKGNDHIGIMFRVPDIHNNDKGYLFGINAEGEYYLLLWNSPDMKSMINWTASDTINTGESAQNTVGIMANEGLLSFYINGEKVDEINDNAYLKGGFGIFVGGSNATNLAGWVDQIRYWELP